MMLLCGFRMRKSTFTKKYSYGVFLNVDASKIEELKQYKLVVIDAQYFTKQDIRMLHQSGVTVYTYFNLGSIENFREYYNDYVSLTLKDYENWEEEKWMDVSNIKWQKFMKKLATSFMKKEVDGFFVDNCDVYYQYRKDKIFQGITKILKELKKTKKAVIINGGDTYIKQYRKKYGEIKEVMDGVNQETVFSSIDFQNNTFGEQEMEENSYFIEHLKKCKQDGIKVYLLEYATDPKLKKKIEKYCKIAGYEYYIANSIE